MLKGLMHTHGMEIPPDALESAITPAPALPAENAPTWGNSNAPPVVDLHNNGWGLGDKPCTLSRSYSGELSSILR